MGLAVKIRGSRRWGNDIRVPQSLEGLVSEKNEYSPFIKPRNILQTLFSNVYIIGNKLKISDEKSYF